MSIWAIWMIYARLQMAHLDCHLEPSGPIWTHLDVYLDPSGAIWTFIWRRAWSSIWTSGSPSGGGLVGVAPTRSRLIPIFSSRPTCESRRGGVVYPKHLYEP